MVYHNIKMVWLNLSTPTTPLQTPYEQLFKVIASWLVTGLNWRLISGFYASKPLPLRCPKIRYFDLFKLIVRNNRQPYQMAEREGFEPSVQDLTLLRLDTRFISGRGRSRTHQPLECTSTRYNAKANSQSWRKGPCRIGTIWIPAISHQGNQLDWLSNLKAIFLC